MNRKLRRLFKRYVEPLTEQLSKETLINPHTKKYTLTKHTHRNRHHKSHQQITTLKTQQHTTQILRTHLPTTPKKNRIHNMPTIKIIGLDHFSRIWPSA